MNRIYLSRRNLLTLLSKLDRKKQGDGTRCTLIKTDTTHPKFAQTIDEIEVIAVEDSEYYVDRTPGQVHHLDELKMSS
jgi:hypothetical protein